ncbi:uncharacterized protein [Argopecten irradians]|uniref:uncharacterized protein n=1 Tax=Argopecten irradians TaxID=31199 RepID=UPI0037130945
MATIMVSSLAKTIGKFKGQVPFLLLQPNIHCRCQLFQLLSTRCPPAALKETTSSKVLATSVVQPRQIHTTKASQLNRPKYLKDHVSLFSVIVGIPSKHPEKGHLVLVDSDLVKRVALVEVASVTVTFLGTLVLSFILPNKTLPDEMKLPLLVSYIFALLALPLLKNMEYKRRISHMYHNAETNVFTVRTKPLFRKSKESSFTAEEVTLADPKVFNGLYVIYAGKRKFFFNPTPDVFRDQNAFTILTGET